jgi:hypothetical protein
MRRPGNGRRTANDPPGRAAQENAMRLQRIARSILLASSLAALSLLAVISTVAACSNGNGFP